MKYCNKCAVSVNSPVEHCPLCYATLAQTDNEPESQTYPNFARKAEKYNLLYRILVFFSLTVSTVCVTINLLTFRELWWSLIVIANILYMWVAISTAVSKRSKLGFNIMVQVVCLSALMVLLDFFAGRNNWALNYVVPFLFISATLSITIIIIVKRMAIGTFILYFFLTALLGFVPIILLAFRQVTVLWPSLVSAIYSGLSMVSIFIFADNTTKVELKKRFHV